MEAALKQVCSEIGECYEMIFVEIGYDQDHVHFLIQTIPPHSPTSIASEVDPIVKIEIEGKDKFRSPLANEAF